MFSTKSPKHWILTMNDKLTVFKMSIYIIAMLTAITGSVSTIIFADSSWVLSEQGAIEILQAVVLLFTLFIYIYALIKNDPGGESMITLFFTVLVWAFILREVDFDKMNLPEFAVFMLYGKGRVLTIFIGFTVALIGASINFKHYINKTIRLIFSVRGALIAATTVFLWTGYFFEHKFGGANGELYEELCELAGYLCLFSSAIITEKISTGIAGDSKAKK